MKNECQEDFPLQKQSEFRKLAPLLLQIIKVHTDLESHSAEAEVLEFEDFHLDAKLLKVHQEMASANEILQNGQDKMAELQIQMATLLNS